MDRILGSVYELILPQPNGMYIFILIAQEFQPKYVENI
jgi:hypothetical protein